MSSSDYAHTSISQPPPGVTPNFDHPQSRAFQAYIGMGVCIVFTAVLLALRIYIKLAMITHMWGWDDCESCKMITSSGTKSNRDVPDGIRTPQLFLTFSALTTGLLDVYDSVQCHPFFP